VAAALAGDLVAADDVRLELPETGVCVSDFAAGTGDCCAEAPAVVKPAAGCCTSSRAAAACCA
jgi:hypothetical protein